MKTKEEMVSVVGGRASRYVGREKPSEYIPFKGNFPLLDPIDNFEYKDAIRNTMWMDELSPKFQRIAYAGNRMYIYERSFLDFLRQLNIAPDAFLEKPKWEKEYILRLWMDASCIGSLTIE